MGLFDAFLADPGSQQGMRLTGLASGLEALGAGLAQAGQMRPLGQPGPSMADAFAGFQRGRQQGLLGAYQQSKMDADMKRRGLLSEAMSDKPDDQISPQARQLRPVLSSLPPEIRGLAGPDELPGLAIQRATSQMRPVAPDKVAQMGLPAGTVVYENAFTGAPQVLHQSKLLTPEEFRQQVALHAAGRGPTTTWRDERDEQGNVIGQISSTGERRPVNAPPMNTGRAMNIIATLGPRVAAGEVMPGTPQFEQYVAAYTVATAPKTTFEQMPDPDKPGAVLTVPRTQPALNVPPVFPNPMDLLARTQGGQGGQPAPAPAAAQPAPAQAAPATAQPPTGASNVPGTPQPPAPPPRQTPEQQKLLQKGEEEFRKLDDSIKEYVELLRKDGTSLGTLLNDPRDPKAQAIIGAYNRVKINLRGESLLNTGVLNGGDIAMLDSIIKDPQSFRGYIGTADATNALLDQFSKQALGVLNLRRQQAGLPPIQPGARTGGATIPPPPSGYVPVPRR